MRAVMTPADEAEVIPTDLLPTNEAVRLIPGRVRGKSIHIGTFYRWLDRGWLRGYYVGGLLFVSVAELRRLIRVRQPRRPSGQKGQPGLTVSQQERLTREVLRRHGIELPGATAEPTKG